MPGAAATPQQVLNLLAVSRLRLASQRIGLSEVIAVGPNLRIAGAELADSRQVRLKRMYGGARYLAQTKSVLVPLPTLHGERLDDAALIEWTAELLAAIFEPAPAPAPEEQPVE